MTLGAMFVIIMALVPVLLVVAVIVLPVPSILNVVTRRCHCQALLN